MTDKVFGTSDALLPNVGRILLYGAELKEVFPEGGSAAVPWFIPAGSAYTVTEFDQALFHLTIDCEGTLDIDGYLVEIVDLDLRTSTNVYTKNQSVRPVVGELVPDPGFTDYVEVDAALSNSFVVNITTTIDFYPPLNITDGMVLNFVFVQVGGGNVLNFVPSIAQFLFPGGTTPVLSTASGSIDFMSMYCYTDDLGDKKLLCVVNKGFA